MTSRRPKKSKILNSQEIKDALDSSHDPEPKLHLIGDPTSGDSDTDKDMDVESNLEDEQSDAFDQEADMIDELNDGDLSESSDVNKEIKAKSAKRKNKSKGRKQEIIWEQFITVKIGNKVTSNKCKLCLNEVSAKPYRMRDHFETCKIESKPKPINSSSNRPSNSSSVAQSTSKAAQMKITNWTDKISKVEKQEIDMDVARLIYGKNLPFRFVESHLFKKMLKRLRPSYELPSRRVIGGSILEKVYQEATEFNSLELQDKKVFMIQDGWSTNQNEPVICHSLTNGIKSYFLNASSAGSSSKTAIYCLGLVDESIIEAEGKYKCEVIGLITDNTESMNALRREFQIKYPNKFVYGCQAHQLNLLGQSLTPKPLLDDINLVQIYFRSHHFESAKLKEFGGTRPVIPAATRWNSQLDTLRSFLKNQAKYLEISRLPGSKIIKNADIFRILNNPDIYKECRNVLEMLEPVAISLDKLQSENSLAADAISQWLDLQKVFKKSDHYAHFEKRRKQAFTPMAIAAYCLHPIYRGKGLESSDLKIGHKYLEDKNPYFVAAAACLSISDENFFPSSMLNPEIIKHMSPGSWWKSLINDGSIPLSLIEFAQNLMIVPASSSALERHLSTMSDIITKKRNRLGIVKAQKLCYIYRTYDENISSDDSDFDDEP